MMRNRQNSKIVVFGRTGSGKSSLGNRLAGDQTVFKIGNTLMSETSITVSKCFPLVDAPSYQTTVIDTPGFADNRVDMKNEDLLANILAFLQNLGDGFNIGIYCISARTRVDAHDIEEFRLIGTLLGQDVFKHTFIAVTQVNMLEKGERARIYQHYPMDLPRILLEHGISGFGPQKILFSDFDNFKQKFVTPLTQILDQAPLFCPQIAQDIDVNDPNSIKRFLATPEMQKIIAHYEDKLLKQGKDLEGLREMMVKQSEESARQIQKSYEEVEMCSQRLEYANKQLSESRRRGDELERCFSDYRQQQTEELRRLTEELRQQEENGRLLQGRIQQKDNQLMTVSSRISELETARQSAVDNSPQNRKGDKWETALFGIVTNVASKLIAKFLP